MSRKHRAASPFLNQALGREENGLPPSKNLRFAARHRAADPRKIGRLLLLLLELSLAVLLALFLVRMFGLRIGISGASMEPTLSDGEEVLLNRLTGRFFSPGAEDLIAFRTEGGTGEVSVKRVVAGPGDTVAIVSGVLYINGETEHTLATLPRISDPGLAAEPLELGPDEYFVLGDNRNNSQDSRYASVGMVHRGQILGRVWMNVSGGHFGLVH